MKYLSKNPEIKDQIKPITNYDYELFDSYDLIRKFNPRLFDLPNINFEPVIDALNKYSSDYLFTYVGSEPELTDILIHYNNRDTKTFSEIEKEIEDIPCTVIDSVPDGTSTSYEAWGQTFNEKNYKEVSYDEYVEIDIEKGIEDYIGEIIEAAKALEEEIER